MIRENTSKYAAKHPAGTVVDEAIATALQPETVNKRLTCKAAHQVAERLGVPPAEVGRTADLLEYRIVECQMGLFGYFPDKTIVQPANEVSEDLRDRLLELTVNGKIDCLSCWGIADLLGVSRVSVAAACEAIDIKIAHCQLGAF